MSTTLTIALAVTALASLIALAHSFHVDVDQLLVEQDPQMKNNDINVKEKEVKVKVKVKEHTDDDHHHHHKKLKKKVAKIPDFVSTQYSKDGLREVIRVSHKGVLAMEHLMPKVEEASIFARQISNGHHLVQLIYTDSDTMVDCNVLKDEHSLNRFLKNFIGVDHPQEGHSVVERTDVVEFLQSGHGSNVTVQFLGGEDLDEKYEDMVDIERHIENCRTQVRSIRQEIKDGVRSGHLHPQLDTDDTDADTDFDIDDTDFDTDDTDFDMDDTDFDTEEEQSSHHRAKRYQLFINPDFDIDDKGDFDTDYADLDRDDTDFDTDEEQSSHHRAKRFIYPGTNWCGKGSSAQRYHDLGENRKTDKCCRAHDHCPEFIEGMSTKYNHFNFGLHTMSHCKCDKRFRRCLKNVSTSTSDMVGNIFFNIMGNSCFRLKKSKVCVKRSWWGKCIKYKKERKANVLDAVTF